ncbi:hypothetical protein [Curtobacterium sp. MCBD17_040]|uniref:hypothetical protein n=1 Tax=Curtobacterium sp. MCBD17_040 TaxID=2175674 RepID=UPI000DA9CEF2|nr:hypothetical protein [Curtobacterium sp. MCBD17_040]WIB65610.1 hypothetical protein DEI94_15945 [Curtobacterium sp. MCBD17_040]
MTTTWTMLPVPEQDADELRELVAERQRSRNQPVAPAPTEVRDRELLASAVKQGALDRRPPWTAAGYAHIAEGTSITMRRIREVMQLLAAHPEQWFSTEDIVEQTSLTLEEWRSACRNIRKRLNAEFPEAPVWPNGEYAGERVWPFTVISGRSIFVRDQLYVALSAAQAATWNEVAGTDGQ